MNGAAGTPQRTGEPAAALSPRDLLARRTWELELLISGALVFSLVQIPGSLAGAFARIQAQVAEGAEMMAILGFVYLQLGIVSLVAALLIHITARALWVGLIGLDAVFPRGIRWHRMTTMGPRMRYFYRRRIPRMATLIQRIDAFCNTIFSVAFAFVLIFVVALFVVTPLAGLATLVDRVAFDQAPRLGTFYAVMALAIGPIMVLPLIDRKIGRRPRRPWLDRAAFVLMRPYYLITGGPVYASISFTLLSNLRKRSYFLGVGAIMAALFFGFVVASLVAADALRLHSLRYAPELAGAREMVPARYESLRDPDRVYRGPSIDADVVEGGYVRLFLPYLPDRHNDLVAERCPDLEPLQPEGLVVVRSRARPAPAGSEARTAEAIRCLGGLWTVHLDGAPVDAGGFDFLRQPGSGMLGLVGYLPVRNLPPGRHLLRISGRTRPGGDPDAVRVYHIPFWS